MDDCSSGSGGPRRAGRAPGRAVEAASRGRWPTVYDDRTEAHWGPGEVLAHVAEMRSTGRARSSASSMAPAGARPVRADRDRRDAHRLRRAGPVAAAARAVRPDRRRVSARFDRRWRSRPRTELARRGVHPSGRDDHRADARPLHRRPPRGRTSSSSTRSSRTRRSDWAALRPRMFVLYAIPIGIVAGFLAGGRLDGLGSLRLRWVPLICSASRPGGDLHRRWRALVGDAGPAIYVGVHGNLSWRSCGT